MIKAVIFDVDSTVVDSADIHAQAWQETFYRYEKQIVLASYAIAADKLGIP